MLGRDADVHRARDRERAVERALLVQAFAPVLRTLPTKAPYVLQGPGENAGVISVGDGLAVAFKIESHNHPSAVEPYQGAATGVGGILRDVFTMGARPIALLNSLRFGSLDHPRVRYLFAGVVKGHRRLRQLRRRARPSAARSCSIRRTKANPLVNAMCVGVMHEDELIRAKAEGVGNPIIAVGRAHRPRRHSRRVVRVGGSVARAARPSGRACRSAIRSPRSCCSRPASS